MQSATNRTCWRASSVPAKAVIQTTSETGSHCVSIHGSPSHESVAYPTTACGESRLIWKGRVTPGTPDELPDFWESAGIERSSIVNNDNTLRSVSFSYKMTDNWTDDVKEFIDLCERGILYDDLMRRLNIPAKRRDSFKRLFFSQVFFGKIKTTGRVRELFARDFPNVYRAINDLKRKDYRQLAYLLQAHESKLMIDVICRRILAELPGTFIATIHDSIMTTPDKADEVRTIMVREFQRFGLNPMIRLEAYL